MLIINIIMNSILCCKDVYFLSFSLHPTPSQSWDCHPIIKGTEEKQGFALDEHSSIGTHLPNFVVGFVRTASVSTKRGTKGQIEPADERASEKSRAEAFNLASVTHSGALTHREERNVKRRVQKQGGSQPTDGRTDDSLSYMWGCKIIFSPGSRFIWCVRKHRESGGGRVGRATPEVRKWPSDGRGRREKLLAAWRTPSAGIIEDGKGLFQMRSMMVIISSESALSWPSAARAKPRYCLLKSPAYLSTTFCVCESGLDCRLNK